MRIPLNFRDVLVDNLPALLDRLAHGERLTLLGEGELNASIYEALGAVRPSPLEPNYWVAPDGKDKHTPAMLPDFVGSIDDALRLLPDGWQWLVRSHKLGADIDVDGLEDALRHFGDHMQAMARVSHPETGHDNIIFAENAPRALTAACLLAIATWVGECDKAAEEEFAARGVVP